MIDFLFHYVLIAIMSYALIMEDLERYRRTVDPLYNPKEDNVAEIAVFWIIVFPTYEIVRLYKKYYS